MVVRGNHVGTITAETDMTTTPEGSTLTEARVLTETEIQERLYGSYGSTRRPPRKPAEQPYSPDAGPTWTGAEILTGELKRLRSELICLRQEKEHLAAQIEQIHRGQLASEQSSVKDSGWVGRIFAVLILLGMVGYVMGMRALQASPAVGDTTPYTVQVAVYDVKGMAVRALSTLQELGYEAFLVELPRNNGRLRYRVYVGSFVTKEEANEESLRLAGDPRFQDFKDSFVRTR